MHIVTVAEMRELEARAEREYGLTSHILMENAGKSAAEILAQYIRQQRSLEGLDVLFLIGPGNNGGDGLVVARYLQQWGANVSLYHWKEQQLTVRGHDIPARDTQAGLETAILSADYIVTALFGTGLSRPLPDSMRALLGHVRQERERRDSLRVVAIDLPERRYRRG
jgi:hydroxyethylthiazole kinase-like uncharacterized protein yjeF